MIGRVIAFQNPAHLSLKLGQLVVHLLDIDKLQNVSDDFKQQHVKTLPIEDIAVVVLDNKQITITSSVMTALLENNVAIVICNDQHMPVGLQLPLDGHNLQSERFRQQIDASEPLKKQMWQQTISAKINGQATVLREDGIEIGNMLAWARQVRSGDLDNLEGRAAVYYWRSVFHNPNFIRGQEEAPPNNLLNYGYAIVRALMARALVSAGLLPTLGIHHHNRYNAYCLADDIMEPYRPCVDRVVKELINKIADFSTLTPAIKQELLFIPFMDVMLDGHKTPLMNAVQLTANSVQKCFSGESRKILYPDW